MTRRLDPNPMSNKAGVGAAPFSTDQGELLMTAPFKGTPTNENIRAATTYGLYNGDVSPNVLGLSYNLTDAGFDVAVDSVQNFQAPNLVHVVGANYVAFVGSALITASFPKLETVTLLDLRSTPSVTSVLLPELTTVTVMLRVASDETLTTIRLPKVTVAVEINLTGNALSQATVDQILADLVANGWGTPPSTVRLQGGTNSYPSEAGVADGVILQGRGATVTYNTPP